MFFEPGPGIRSSLRDLPTHLTLLTVSHGFMGWVFSITGPMLILLSVAEQGKVPIGITVSWVTIGYSVAGITSWILSLRYRQPLTAAMTIPGMVLVGSALSHVTFPEVIGAYLVTAALLILIALSGKIKTVMDWFPLPIAMAMVAGVFLPFGLNIMTAWANDPWLSIPTTLIFLVISFFPGASRTFPPILGAILVGLFVATLTGQTHGEMFELKFGRLSWVSPAWSFAAITELSIPLVLSVVAIQNAQGTMVLRMAKYQAPLNAMTWACGLGTIISALFGSAPTCITGPVNAIISAPSAGPSEGRYAAGIVTATLWLMTASLASVVVLGREILPVILINLLAGLALFPVLGNAFVEAFKDTYRFGALTCFMITVSQISIWNVGAPFWGLVTGLLVSMILDSKDKRLV